MNNIITSVQKTRYEYIKKILDFIRYNDLEFDLNEEDL
jgi:hypothetical protein